MRRPPASGPEGLRVASAGTCPGRRSATLLALLACHAQCGTREGHQPHLADGVAARLTDAVRAVVDATQGAFDLGQLVPLAVEDGELVVTLEAARADIGLVLAGAVAGVPHQPVEFAVEALDDLEAVRALLVQLVQHLLELGLGPRRLACLDDELAGRRLPGRRLLRGCRGP